MFPGFGPLYRSAGEHFGFSFGLYERLGSCFGISCARSARSTVVSKIPSGCTVLPEMVLDVPAADRRLFCASQATPSNLYFWIIPPRAGVCSAERRASCWRIRRSLSSCTWFHAPARWSPRTRPPSLRGREAAVTDNSVDQAISRLRKILGGRQHRTRYIETVPNRGYRFVSLVERTSIRESNAWQLDHAAW